jgi:hypothetical protein
MSLMTLALAKGRNTDLEGADVDTVANRRLGKEGHRHGKKALLQDLHELRLEEPDGCGALQEVQAGKHAPRQEQGDRPEEVDRTPRSRRNALYDYIGTPFQ